MNERIKQLIIETDEWLENNAQSDRWEREVKFAQLIVQECCKIVNVNGSNLEAEIVADIKEQFGIK